MIRNVVHVITSTCYSISVAFYSQVYVKMYFSLQQFNEKKFEISGFAIKGNQASDETLRRNLQTTLACTYKYVQIMFPYISET